MAGLRRVECNGLLPCRARCEALRLTNLFRGTTPGLKLGLVDKIGAVDPLAVDPLDIEIVDPGRGGVETRLSLLRDDKVDIRRSQDDLAVPVLLGCNNTASCTEGSSLSCRELLVQSSSSCTSVSGVEPSVHFPLLNLFSDDSGRPTELRFRSREVGAETDCEIEEGVEGSIDVGRTSLNEVDDGAFRLFRDVGLRAVGCWGLPKARPTAATPTVPIAQSCQRPLD